MATSVSAAKPKLLVVELWGVGDVVISTPFLIAACEKYEVTVLAKPFAHDLRTRFWPQVKVIECVAPWTAFKGKYRLWAWPWRQLFRTFLRLRRERFDVGVSVRWDPRDHILLHLAGVKMRVGFSRMGSRVHLTHPLKRPPPLAHRVDQWRILAQALGFDFPLRGQIPLPPRPAGGILVHTGAGQPVRVWALPKFRNLVGRLRGLGYEVQVACDADQRDWWLAAGEKDVITPGTISELLELVGRAGLFIGNDSGPGHLAAFSGVPTFTIFGPQLSEWFAPLHPDASWIDGKACPYKPCSDYCRFPVVHCMQLSEEEVWAAVKTFVEKNTHRVAANSKAALT